MWWVFGWQAIHFGVYFLIGLAFLMLFWLYADAWWVNRERKTILVLAGYLLMALSFGVLAAFIDGQEPVRGSWEWGGIFSVGVSLRLLALVCLALGMWLEPIQPKPKTHALQKKSWKKLGEGPAIWGGWLAPISLLSSLLFGVIAAGMVCWRYWFRAHVGLERHVWRMALGWGLVSVALFLDLARLLRGGTHVWVFEWVKAYGWIWIGHHILLAVAAGVFIRWVSQYLLKRLLAQLFFVFMFAVLGVYLLTTAAFTALLLKQMEGQTTETLNRSVALYSYALKRHQEAMVSDAGWLATLPQLRLALENDDTEAVATIAANLLETKAYSQVAVVDADQTVWQSPALSYEAQFTSEPLVRRVLLGEKSASGVSVMPGVLFDQILLVAAAPLQTSKTLDVVVVVQVVDGLFLGEIKSGTGMEAAVYAGDQLAAMSVAIDEEYVSQIGTDVLNDEVREAVLSRGEVWTGIRIWNAEPYLTSLRPLKNNADVSVGALGMGEPEEALLNSSKRAMQLTFGLALGLMIASVIPALLIARALERQVH